MSSSVPFSLPSLAASLPAANSACIGGGCPGSGGSSHVGAILLGILLLIAAVALLAGARRQDRLDRIGSPEPRAASVGVTLMRAGALLAALFGVVVLVIRP